MHTQWKNITRSSSAITQPSQFCLLNSLIVPHIALPRRFELKNGHTGLDSVRALAARSWDFLSLPNCAPEIFVHARRHGFVVLISNVFTYRLRVLEAVATNTAMPLVAGEAVWTP